MVAADHAAGELQPNPAELTDARWFALDELPRLPSRISISRALIDGPGVALLWVLALLAFEVFFSRRAWCRYACPIGLTYGVVGFLKRREGIDVFDRGTDFSPFGR